MKNKYIILVLASLFAFSSGCGNIKNSLKHTKSSLVGLNREITLYNANGIPIKVWITKAKVEDRGGTCYFLDGEGKAVTISGTFIVQEK